MLQDRIKQAFDKELNRTFANKAEVLKYLMQHPNRLKTIEKLSVEIRVAELNPRIKLTGEKIDAIAADIAKFYAHAAIGAKEFEIRSDAQRVKERMALDNEKYINELEDTMTELGVKDVSRKTESAF